MNEPETTAHGTDGASDHSAHHGDDLRTAQVIFAILMGLLVVTVGVAYIDVGTILALPLAMSVATVKALLILIYFMHLSHESTLVRVFAASGFVSLSILFVIVFADYLARFPAAG